MTTVVDLMKFKGRGVRSPTLVLVDLHHVSEQASPGLSIEGDPLENCRAALAHARANGFPIGFTRRVAPPANPASTPAYPRWIQGFEPSRHDMIFDRWRPSCYASAEFAEMADSLGGNYVLAGQFAEMSCLSTAIDAFHRDHRPTFLTDALVVHSDDALLSVTMQRAVTHLVSLYAEGRSTRNWLLTSARRLRVRE